MRPVDIVKKLCPRAKPSYLAAFENGDALFAQNGITTPLRVAHFCAQAFHETGGLTIEWESGAYSADRLLEIFGVGHHSAGVTEAEAQQLARNGPAIFERVYGLGNPSKARELGNTQPGDGFKYRGGGILQTTGRANYKRMGQKCGVDFESHPELVLSAEHALKPALAEWTEGNLNEKADQGDLRAITRKINGGYNGLSDRQEWFNRIKPLASAADVAPAPPVAKPVVPPPADEGVRGDPEIWNVQRRLKAMMYNPGGLDGLWGGLSAGAITGFINDRQSNITPPASIDEFHTVQENLKAEISQAETERYTRPIAPERALATPEELAPKLPEVKAAITAERLGFWGSIGAGISTALTGVAQYMGDAIEWLNKLKTVAGDLPWGVWVAGAFVVSLLLYYISTKSGQAKTEATKAYQSGERS